MKTTMGQAGQNLGEVEIFMYKRWGEQNPKNPHMKILSIKKILSISCESHTKYGKFDLQGLDNEVENECVPCVLYMLVNVCVRVSH